MTPEWHIAGVIVHAMPPRAAQVCAFIDTLPHAQVHGRDASGKLVLTLEGESAHAVVDQIEQLQRADGVLNAVLVYQHADTLDSMNKELDHADHPT